MSIWKKTDPETARANAAARDAEVTAKQKSQRRMADFLKEQVDSGVIVDDWEIGFIGSIHLRVNSALPYLTDKQDAVLVRLFEKY